MIHPVIFFHPRPSGLEVVHLKPSHVDPHRMQLFVERGKGKKDRVVNLSPVLLDVLREYVRSCKVRLQVCVFEGLLTRSTLF